MCSQKMHCRVKCILTLKLKDYAREANRSVLGEKSKVIFNTRMSWSLLQALTFSEPLWVMAGADL